MIILRESRQDTNVIQMSGTKFISLDLSSEEFRSNFFLEFIEQKTFVPENEGFKIQENDVPISFK